MSPDEERLMQLFQNRAGLKKAYADLQGRVSPAARPPQAAGGRDHPGPGAVGRARRFARRSAHRVRRAGVFPAARACGKPAISNSRHSRRISTRQQETRETAKHKADCEAAKSARLADVRPAAAGGGGRGGPAAAATGRGAKGDSQRLTAFWHYFKRRRRAEVAASPCAHVVTVADAAVGDLHAERSAIKNEATAPNFRASRWRRGATSIWPSSVMPNCCASTSMPSGSRRAPRRRWRGACTR